MRKIIIASLASLLCAVSLSAQDNSTAAFPYSQVDRSPVTAALAGASLSSTENLAWGAFSNTAAALYGNKTLDVQASWQNWMPKFDGGSSYNVAAGYNTGRFAVSVAGSYLSGKAYDVIGEDGISKGFFTPNDIYGGVGVGFKIVKGLSAGINAKFFRTSLSESSSYGAFSGDAYLTWHKSSVTVSVGGSDLGSSVTSADGTSFSLPSAVFVSGAYDHSFGDSRIFADLDCKYYFNGGVSASVGAKYTFRDMVSAGIGYHFAGKDAPVPAYASAGIGVKFFGVNLNASYIFASETLAGTLAVGIGYSF